MSLCDLHAVFMVHPFHIAEFPSADCSLCQMLLSCSSVNRYEGCFYGFGYYSAAVSVGAGEGYWSPGNSVFNSMFSHSVCAVLPLTTYGLQIFYVFANTFFKN